MAFLGGALGGMGAGLLGPVLGMIPQAPGGPPNPFAPQSNNGGGSAPANNGGGLLNTIGTDINSLLAKGKNFVQGPMMYLAVGGGILVILILIK